MNRKKIIGALKINWDCTDAQAKAKDPIAYERLKESYEKIVHIEVVWKLKKPVSCRGAAPTVWETSNNTVRKALKKGKLKIIRKDVEFLFFFFSFCCLLSSTGREEILALHSLHSSASLRL